MTGVDFQPTDLDGFTEPDDVCGVVLQVVVNGLGSFDLYCELEAHPADVAHEATFRWDE